MERKSKKVQCGNYEYERETYTFDTDGITPKFELYTVRRADIYGFNPVAYLMVDHNIHRVLCVVEHNDTELACTDEKILRARTIEAVDDVIFDAILTVKEHILGSEDMPGTLAVENYVEARRTLDNLNMFYKLHSL